MNTLFSQALSRLISNKSTCKEASIIRCGAFAVPLLKEQVISVATGIITISLSSSEYGSPKIFPLATPTSLGLKSVMLY